MLLPGRLALLLPVLLAAACSDGSHQLVADPLNESAGETGDVPMETPPEKSLGLSYFADTKAIIDSKCAICHEPGGIAPFALDSYETVHNSRSAAAFAVRSGTMPPWPPTKGYTKLARDRSLSDEDRYTLLSWLEGEAERGYETEFEPPAAAETQPEVEFDLTLQLPSAYTPQLQPDDHRCFAIPWPLDEFRYLTNVDVQPDVAQQVHHVIVSVGNPEDAAIYLDADGADGRPGWRCLGAPNVPGGPIPRQVGGWVPGAGRDGVKPGTGNGIEPGSVLVVQMHYNTLFVEPEPDQTTFLFQTTGSVERPAGAGLITDPAWLQAGGMPIAAGDPDARHSFTFPGFILPLLTTGQTPLAPTDDYVLHYGFVHMHTLGKTGRITLQRADGSEQVLLDIRDWDFDWQGTYEFEREVLVRPADSIRLDCSWDNTAARQQIIDGRQIEPQDVEWGDGTNDEMCLMSYYITAPQTDYDYSHVPSFHIESPEYRQQFRPGDLIPLRLLFNNFHLHEPMAHDHSSADMHDVGGDHAMDEDGHDQVYHGHYHVYLDTEDDAADHLTAWDDVYYYQLPQDIQSGEHTLRINLRAEDHHALGIEQRVPIQIVESPAEPAVSLVEVNDWQFLAASEDVLAERRPDSVECPDNAWYNEDGALEVETGYCNYLALGQPSKAALRAGDSLKIVLWHGALRFEEPATGHAVISVDGKIVWETRVEIPSGAGIFDVDVPVDFDAPAGSEVQYHVYNHGFNTWTLLALQVNPRQP